MSCQVLIACVTNAVYDLTQSAKPQTWSEWIYTKASNAPEPMKFLFFILFMCLMLLTIFMLIIFLTEVMPLWWRHFLPHPSEVRKRYQGRFVEGD